ncbi:MAG TPA: hypothetical protein VMV10_14300 [Pirellulales bacterium]|nr:hypothetical protein [Pirellulales bacterium]
MFNSGPNRRLSMALAACFLVWPYHAALSDCPTPEADRTEEDHRREAVGREARSFKLSLDGDKSDVTLVEEPVLRWGNSIRGGASGGTFLWTAKGLPVATCCIWWSDPRTICLAFGSLTEKPIRAEKQGRTIWHSKRPGLEYRDVPDAPATARSATTRLTQLRNIAREFRAVLVYGDQGTEDLRLLPQPLYRYSGDDSAIEDGAVFAFATGTDPELILQIEAVAGDHDALRWRYAVTRRTSGALRLSHKDNVVWTCSRTEGAFGEPFFVCPAP